MKMSKIYNAVMGLVVGDALGVPVEFKQRDTYKVDNMMGYGTYNQPPGTWSDDSSMMLATLESIGRREMVDPNDIMNNFYYWYTKAAFTPYNEVFDVGGATKKAIIRYASGMEALKCGGTSEFDNGNGSLMRILPLAFLPYDEELVKEVSAITHAHRIAIKGCQLYTIIAQGLLMDIPLKFLLSDDYVYTDEYARIPKLATLTRDEIKSSGYVVDTLEAALWCVLHTDNYRDCVLTAVNLGEDTDPVAAVAGGLAGIIYGRGGEKGIPEEWIREIPRKYYINGLCTIFESVINK
jgi:ADP-ribosylglycohydrolase